MPRSVLLIALFISLTAFYSVLLSRKGKVSDRLTDLIVETKKEKKLAEDLKPEKKNKTAELVKAFPNKFKGFIFVDPNKGQAAVREFETCVKEYGLHALYLTGFRTQIPASDKKNYPLYSKACELGVPVHIYSSVNYSKAVPYDIGHPRYIDQVARDFPELKIMAGVSGFPWVMDFMAVAMRNNNVYLNFETYEPYRMNMRGSGLEPYLYFGEYDLKHKMCFATNWTAQGTPIEEIIAQVDALPWSDSAKECIFYENAKRFYEEL